MFLIRYLIEIYQAAKAIDQYESRDFRINKYF